jgi:hypothetical protein
MILRLFNVLRLPVSGIKQHYSRIVQQMLHKVPVLSRQPSAGSQLTIPKMQAAD